MLLASLCAGKKERVKQCPAYFLLVTAFSYLRKSVDVFSVIVSRVPA
jgi:hypothetical protein